LKPSFKPKDSRRKELEAVARRSADLLTKSLKQADEALRQEQAKK